jgi:hypothetical protein
VAVDTAALEALWRATGNTGDRPVGWFGPGGSPNNPNYGGAGGGDLASTVAGQFRLSDADKAALQQLKSSGIDYNAIEQQSFKDYGPYYERILKESNYDLATAKARLEEDYQKGLRTNREDASTALKTLTTQTNPAEQRATLDNLNRRGFLDTQVDNANQPTTETLPDGSTATTQPVTTKGFGGAGGQILDTLRTSQSSRQEAITRALKRNEEQSAVTKARQFTDLDVGKQRDDFAKEQERKEKATALAGERYARQIQRNEIKRGEILDPYLNNNIQSQG